MKNIKLKTFLVIAGLAFLWLSVLIRSAGMGIIDDEAFTYLYYVRPFFDFEKGFIPYLKHGYNFLFNCLLNNHLLNSFLIFLSELIFQDAYNLKVV